MNLDDENNKIEQVVNFGVPRNLARRALVFSNWDVNNSVNSYLDGLVTDGGNNREEESMNLGGGYAWGAWDDYKFSDLTEEELKNLKLNRTPLEVKKKVKVMMTKDIPKILPIPNNQEEFEARIEEYEKKKNSRRYEFLKRSIEGYLQSRESYFHVVSHIFFVVLHPYKKLLEINPMFSETEHSSLFKKVIIASRKIAECDYFVGLFEEGMTCCLTNIAILDIWNKQFDFPMPRKIMKMTYSVMAKIMMEMGNLEKSKKYIEMGLEDDSNSIILRRSEIDLVHLVKGEEVISDRFKILQKELFKKNCLTVDTFPIRFPIGESYRIKEVLEDDFLEERVDYVREEEVMKNQNLDELMIYVKIKNNEQRSLIWKSLIC